MNRLNTFLDKYYTQDEPIILGCSAGPDSMYILYHILKTDYKKNLVVGYFNHKTRPETDEEEKFLETLCKKEGISFEAAECDFEKIQRLYPSKSFEELAREKRYQFFDALCNIYKTNKVITGHHLDDRIETFFFNMIRGTKLTGLINMRENHGGILRPLLGINKKEILAHLDRNNLDYKIDQTNEKNIYTRNKVRNLVIPEIEKIHPEYQKNLQNLIHYFEEAKEYIDKEVQNFLEEQGIEIFNSKKYSINTLKIYGYFYIDAFLKKSPFFQKELIRHIFSQANNNSTIGLSEANISEIIKFIGGKNNKTEKKIRDFHMKKENKIVYW